MSESIAMVQKISDPKELFTYIFNVLDTKSIKAISFDVFDTLILRRVTPDLILEALARRVEYLLDREKIPHSSNALAAYHKAYAELSHANITRGLDGEVFTDDLYPAWVRAAIDCVLSKSDSDKCTYDKNKIGRLANALRNDMTRYETASCIANNELIPLLDELKRRNIPLYYISDMYLGGECIAKILHANNLSSYFMRGFVSGDLALLKRSGLLFKHVIQEIGSSNILHIGDNPLSDGEMAEANGFSAAVYQSNSVKNRIKYLRDEYLHFKRFPSWGGRLAAVFSAEQNCSTVTLQTKSSDEREYGYTVLAPIFVSFIHKVLERAHAEKVKHLCFLAREGHLLKSIADKLLDLVWCNEEKPKLTYLLTSRISTIYSASAEFGLREISASLANGRRNLKNLLSPLKLNNEQLLNLAAKYGIKDGDWILPDFFLSWPPFLALIKDEIIRERWKELRDTEGGLLMRYLQQEGITHSARIGIVDVGWLGQIQDNLHLSLKSHGFKTQVFGFYLGLTLAAHWRKSEQNWVEWCMCDEEHPDWSASAAFLFPQGIEIITRAAHGTVTGYKLNETSGELGIEAVLKSESDPSRKLESLSDDRIAQFQLGILDYCDRYRDIAEMAGLNAESTLPYARDLLDRMLRFPTKQEASWFLEMANISDFGSDEHFKIGNDQQLSICKPRELREALQRSFWKHGTLSSLGRAAQLIWSVCRELRLVKKASINYGAGILYHQPPSLPPSTIVNRDNINDDLPSNLFARELDLKLTKRLEELKIADRLNATAHAQSNIQTQQEISFKKLPLSCSEVMWCYANFLMVKLGCKISSRRPIKRGGIAMRIYVTRWIEAYLKP